MPPPSRWAAPSFSAVHVDVECDDGSRATTFRMRPPFNFCLASLITFAQEDSCGHYLACRWPLSRACSSSCIYTSRDFRSPSRDGGSPDALFAGNVSQKWLIHGPRSALINGEKTLGTILRINLHLLFVYKFVP